MQIHLTIDNADEKLLKALKGVINLYPNAKLKTQIPTKSKTKESSMQKALKELKNKEYESFKDFKSYKEAMAKSIKAEYKLLPTKTKDKKKTTLSENGYTKEFEESILREAKHIKENPHLYKAYKNVDIMFKDILK